jgi:RHS repeat-associated protein
VPTVAYSRGLDLSQSLEGAGGIGGLLARSHGYSGGSWGTHNYYHADGGGNITALVNSSQTIVASYKYDSFGRTLSLIGTMATANVYRFSSKEIEPNTGYYDYGFRFYDPLAQRWLNRDPLGEEYDINLYRFVYNSPLNYVDPDGLWGIQFGDFNIGWGDPNLAFDSDSRDDLGRGAQATLDGIIPFGDPFMNNGGYDPCDETLAASRALGQFGRDVYTGRLLLGGAARLGGTRLGNRLLNSNRYFRIGPGRMPAKGRFPASPNAPRISIGRGPGNPHIDLRP